MKVGDSVYVESGGKGYVSKIDGKYFCYVGNYGCEYGWYRIDKYDTTSSSGTRLTINGKDCTLNEFIDAISGKKEKSPENKPKEISTPWELVLEKEVKVEKVQPEAKPEEPPTVVKVVYKENDTNNSLMVPLSLLFGYIVFGLLFISMTCKH